MRRKKETTVVGLDIGASNIRAVQVTIKDGVTTVQKAAEIALPPDRIVAGEIMDKDAVVDAIKMLWKSHKFDTQNIRLGVGGDKVVARLAELDWQNDKDFTLLLPSQVRNNLAIINPEDYALDFHTLSEYVQRKRLPRDDQGVLYRGSRNIEENTVTIPKKHVLIVAAPKDLVRAYVEVAAEAGLKPISVDIKSLAILRAFSSELSSGEEPLADVSIDIGATSTIVVVHKSGQPLLTRTLTDRGGRAITQRLQDELQLSFTRAEKRKMNVFYEDLAAGETNQSDDWSFDAFGSAEDSQLKRSDAPRGVVSRTEVEEEEYNLAIAEAHDAVHTEISELVNEIKRTLNWFKIEAGTTDFEGFNKFVLTGAGAGIPKLAERLSDEFQTNVVLGSPLTFQNHKELPENIIATEHEFATALGLAIGQGSSHG